MFIILGMFPLAESYVMYPYMAPLSVDETFKDALRVCDDKALKVV